MSDSDDFLRGLIDEYVSVSGEGNDCRVLLKEHEGHMILFADLKAIPSKPANDLAGRVKSILAAFGRQVLNVGFNIAVVENGLL